MARGARAPMWAWLAKERRPRLLLGGQQQRQFTTMIQGANCFRLMIQMS